jgi:hypothetical protein
MSRERGDIAARAKHGRRGTRREKIRAKTGENRRES